MKIPDELLLQTEKPGRYAGGEVNSVINKPDAVVRFAFCFPDSYEVGMSWLGLQIMYFFLNRRGDCRCERAFMPRPDMLKLMRENNLPLCALESGGALREFDIVGFTLQYEMNYTNVLAMLDLAGVPLLSAERGEEWPVICAGGPCAINPEPMSAFADFFYIGDGEAGLDEIIERYKQNKKRGGSKTNFLESIAPLPGVYVPVFYDAEYDGDGRLLSFKPINKNAQETVMRVTVESLDEAFFPDRFIVPSVETVHDRAMVEIFRGCGRGCRFCQAGFTYRPVRERKIETLIAQAEMILKNTGYEELSLVSLASCDHSGFEPLVDGLIERLSDKKISISLPSLRLDAVSVAALQKTQSVRKSSLTFAPEAGSDRLRDVINKNLSEEEILEGCGRAFGAGFDRIKLYFMTGLPTETETDVAGIARLSEKIVDRYYGLPYEQRKRPVSVSVSCSGFVPKPFTPFQWARQDSAAEFIDKQRAVKQTIRKKQISYRYHDANTAVVEGLLARGGRPVSRAILEAYRNGAVFDGWTDLFNYGAWKKAFETCGIDAEEAIGRERMSDEKFPWDFVDVGVTKDFLRAEWERAMNGTATPGCREACAGCGVCDG